MPRMIYEVTRAKVEIALCHLCNANPFLSQIRGVQKPIQTDGATEDQGRGIRKLIQGYRGSG